MPNPPSLFSIRRQKAIQFQVLPRKIKLPLPKGIIRIDENRPGGTPLSLYERSKNKMWHTFYTFTKDLSNPLDEYGETRVGDVTIRSALSSRFPPNFEPFEINNVKFKYQFTGKPFGSGRTGWNEEWWGYKSRDLFNFSGVSMKNGGFSDTNNITMITPRHGVFAKHFSDKPKAGDTATFSDHDTGEEKTFTIESAVTDPSIIGHHPYFTTDNDIGIVKFTEDVNANANIKIYNLPLFTGYHGISTGEMPIIATGGSGFGTLYRDIYAGIGVNGSFIVKEGLGQNSGGGGGDPQAGYYFPAIADYFSLYNYRYSPENADSYRFKKFKYFNSYNDYSLSPLFRFTGPDFETAQQDRLVTFQSPYPEYNTARYDSSLSANIQTRLRLSFPLANPFNTGDSGSPIFIIYDNDILFATAITSIAVENTGAKGPHYGLSAVQIAVQKGIDYLGNEGYSINPIHIAD